MYMGFKSWLSRNKKSLVIIFIVLCIIALVLFLVIYNTFVDIGETPKFLF